MGQYMTGTQDAFLFIEDGTQQDIGIDEPLHQDIGLAILTQGYGTASTLFLVVAIDVNGFDKSHFFSFFYCIAGTGVMGTYHSHTFTVSSLLQEDNHVI